MTDVPPPYTPGFGRRPPVLAGRDAILARTLRALTAGPAHPEFCSALLGHRGVGKTILLDSIGASAGHDISWAVLHVQALRDESLLATMAQRIPSALEPWGRMGRAFKGLQADLSVAVNLGVVSASATAHSPPAVAPPPAAAAFEDLLVRVGQFAARHQTGLLITVDEAQVASPQDLAGIARALQTVVSRREQPISMFFSGLPTFRERLAAAGTFAGRLPTHHIGDLDPSASRLALVEPAARHHVAWDPAALDLVTARSGGHPYHLQLFGWHAWEAASGADSITVAHATAGLATARSELDGQWTTSWMRLRPQERDYLAAVVATASTGAAGVDEVAELLGKHPRQLAVARDRLIHNHGFLEAPERGKVRFTSSEMADWVAARDHRAEPRDHEAAQGEVVRSQKTSPAPAGARQASETARQAELLRRRQPGRPGSDLSR